MNKSNSQASAWKKNQLPRPRDNKENERTSLPAIHCTKN
jgi:hypothetical protein